MNRRKLLFFCTLSPYPPNSGLQRRCLELLAGFRAIGCETTLLGCYRPRYDQPWTSADIEVLKKDYVHSVDLYPYRRWHDDAFMRVLNTFHRVTRRPPPINSALHTPLGMRLWYREHFRRLVPDLTLTVYAYWDGLLQGIPRGGERRIMETIDLLTLNVAMWKAVYQRLPPAGTPATDQEILREDFYERLALHAKPEEFAVYDKYDDTICISPGESEQIAARTRRTRVHYIPMTMPPVYQDNTYDGAAIFPTGPNPFNEQACHYFAQRVLPALRREVSDFRLLLTGACSGVVPLTEEIERSGFVPDLATVYRRAPFLACPVIGGTGQLVKVIEAMAHGVPAIVLQAARHRTIIQDGEDGLIARDAAEFASHAARLWRDRALCRRLGEAARERVASEFSRERLASQLEAMIADRA